MKYLSLMLSTLFLASACGGGGGGGSSSTSNAFIASPRINLAQVGGNARPTQSAQQNFAGASQKLGSVTQSSNISGGTTLDQVEVELTNTGGTFRTTFTNDRDGDGDTSDMGEWEFIHDNTDRFADGGPGTLYSAGAVVGSNGALKNPEDYVDGDYFLVTGFWHRSTDDFGVFLDGQEVDYALPTSGSAAYTGEAYGVVYPSDPSHTTYGVPAGQDLSDHEYGFTGDLNVGIAFTGSTPTFTSGRITNLLPDGETSPDAMNDGAFNLVSPTWDATHRAFHSGSVEFTCPSGISTCTLPASGGDLTYVSSWGGQFFKLSEGGRSSIPEFFGGTFGVHGLLGRFDLNENRGVSYSVIGFFGGLETGCTLPVCDQ